MTPQQMLEHALMARGLPPDLNDLIGQRFIFEYDDRVLGCGAVAGLVMGCEIHDEEANALGIKNTVHILTLFISVPMVSTAFTVHKHREICGIVFMGKNSEPYIKTIGGSNIHGTFKLL